MQLSCCVCVCVRARFFLTRGGGRLRNLAAARARASERFLAGRKSERREEEGSES